MKLQKCCCDAMIWVSDEEWMPNKHLDHLEDSILTGRRVALGAVKQALSLTDNISIKYDGAPAIVFGTNPENDKFFVGTKSVFNKRLIKINYSHEDIDKNHQGIVADILRLAFDNVPRINRIVQADWIGVGGGSVYCPNIVRYRFATKITKEIILAPHTEYTAVGPDVVGKPISKELINSLNTLSDNIESSYFVDTTAAKAVKCPFNGLDILAKVVALLPFTKVPSSKKARVEISKHINWFVRDDSWDYEFPSSDYMYDLLDAKYKREVNVNTFKVWQLIHQLKMRVLNTIQTDGSVICDIKGKSINHEGFVTVADTQYKLVDRLTFSRANFNLDKDWTHEKV